MNDVIARLNAALEGRYRIERELGQGGMATVYLAEDVRHRRQVALKVLRPELAAVVGAERFLAEIETTANLQHPHILPLFDSGEADSFLFYVMPYVQGESLRDKLDREKQLRVDDALSLARKVADALDYAHEQGVVHRDIKPANILLSNRGEPLVADFGIALAVSQAGGGRITETGLSLGTPHYMSPEQATGDRDVDPRSDVYALGCVLYEMLAGEPPFAASTSQAVLARILTEEPRRVSELRRTVPSHVDAVVAKSLEKLPADRFGSASEFKDALDDEHFVYSPRKRGQPGEVTTPGGWPRIEGGRLVGALLAALVVALALAGWALLGSDSSAAGPSVRSVLDLGAVEQPPDPFFDVVISPDGSRFAAQGEVEGVNGIYHRTAEDMEFRLVPGTEGDVWSLSFSPDGEWLAYTHADEGLMKVSLRGGRPTLLVPQGDLEPRLAHWGPGGWIIFWAAKSGGGSALFRIPDTGGTAEEVVGSPWTAMSPRLLPDGRGVIFTDENTLSIAVHDLEADTVRTLVQHGIEASYVASGHLLYLDGGGGLWAAPFDIGRRELIGDAKPVLQGVMSEGPFGRYSVSDNGTLVYGAGGAQSRRSYELAVVPLEGTLATLDLPARDLQNVSWNPDGRRVVFAGRPPGQTTGPRHIYVYDVPLENAPRSLTTEGDNIAPVWSPDGRRVVFSSRREGTQGWDLFLQNVDDDLPPRLLLSLPEYQWATDWPEENLLMIESGSPTGLYRVVLDGDSTIARSYYVPDADVDHARISPDGTLAAYHSDESGRDEVYVRSFPELGGETMISTDGGRFAEWSPAGDLLYYLNLQGDTLYAAEIAREPAPYVASRSAVRPWVNDAPPPRLHPDGDRFIAERRAASDTLAGEESEPQRYVLIHNWFSELERIFAEDR